MSIANTESPTIPKQPERRFSNTLTRTIFILLSVIALLPALVLATASYFRTRSLLENQARTQLQNIVRSQALQVQLVAIPGQKAMGDLVVQSGITNVIEDLIDNPNDLDLQKQALTFLYPYTVSAPGSNYNIFDHILVVLPNGSILSSTNPAWEGTDISGDSTLSELVGNNQTIFSFGSLLYPDDLIIFSSRTIFNLKGERFATVIGTYTPSEIPSLLVSLNAFFPKSQAYLISAESAIVGVSPSGQQLIPLVDNQLHLANIKDMTGSGEGFSAYTSLEGASVLAYGKRIPDHQTTLVLEIPEQVIFSQLQDLANFGVLLLAVTFTVMGIGILSIADRFVAPIIDLSNTTREFAEGNWEKRAQVERSDELGYLAYSFNRMVEQLSDLYRSLERKVEERTKQLRTASEIAQVATQTTRRDEIFRRTVNLMTERFDYNYASIFSLDAGGSYLTLEEEAGNLTEVESGLGGRFGLNQDSVISWVASNKEPRVIRDLAENPFPISNAISGSHSEATIPIMLGSQIIAVLDIQSADKDAFDPETVSIFQSLSNQIASGVQNIMLLESTQVNLEETSILYRSSRAISQAETHNEVKDLLISTLEQSSYVHGLYSIEDAYLLVENIHDPKFSKVQASVKGLTLPVKDTLENLENAAYVIIEDLESDQRFGHILSYYQRRDCKVAALLPIRQMDRVTQFIVLASRDQDGISEAALQPFSSLVDVTSSTLNRLAILDNLGKRVSELRSITTASQLLSQDADLNTLYTSIHHHILENIGSDISFGVTLYNPKSEMMNVPFYAEGTEITPMAPFPVGEGLSSLIIKTREPVFIQENVEQRSKELGARVVGVPAKSWLGVPLIAGGDILGAIVLQDTINEGRFDQADLDWLLALAPQVAIAIRNEQLTGEKENINETYNTEQYLFNILLEKTPDQIYIKDTGGKYLRVSQQYAESFQTSPEKMVGKSDLQLLGRDVGLQMQSELESILASNEPSLGEVENEIRSGESKWYQKYRYPLFNDQNVPVGVLGIRSDISEQKRVEQLARRRADQLMTASEIARDASQSLLLSELLERAVNLVRDRFEFYHASIFLVDRANEYAVLMESTGTAGAQLKASGHKLAVGSQSLVGQCVARNAPMVVNDVTAEDNYYPNPLLPDTRSELSIPMMISEEVLGVLDVQSTQKNAFFDDEIGILQILADQLAIAVLNSKLFTQSSGNLNLHRIVNQTTSEASLCIVAADALAVAVRNLSAYKPDVRVCAYLADDAGILRLTSYAGFGDAQPATIVSPSDPVIGKSLMEDVPLLISDSHRMVESGDVSALGRSAIVVPVTYASRSIGVLVLDNPEADIFDDNEMEIVFALSRNLGSIVNNIKLLAENRLQIERERHLFEITSHIRRSMDVDTILKTSVQEIGKVLHASKARISLSPMEPDSSVDPISMEDDKHAPKNGNNGHQIEELL